MILDFNNMKIVCYKSVYIICFIFSTLSCTKNAISPVKTYDIAVEGTLNTFQNEQYIRLSKPAILPSTNVEPVRKAIVSISDGNNKVFLKETKTPGLYSGVINDNKNYDQPYTLNIDYNQFTYTAIDTLRRVIAIKVSDLPFSAKKLSSGKIQLKIPRHMFGALVPSRWLILYTGKKMWDPSILNKKAGYSYSHQFGSPNTLYSSTQQITTAVLNPSDTVVIYKFSLSASYSKYLYNVFQETDFKNIFSSTPGSIYGNVSNNGQGFFYSTDVDVKQYLASDFVK